MNNEYTYRRARIEDLPKLIELLQEDELGLSRETVSEQINPRYIKAFHDIDKDPNQYLMVMTNSKQIVATCHLRIMASLTFTGTPRMQIEAVRVVASMRGQKIGAAMLQEAIKYGQSQNVGIFQLTTNKKRLRAQRFYEKLGFQATHEGMKLYVNSV